jgi:phasin family protein
MLIVSARMQKPANTRRKSAMPQAIVTEANPTATPVGEASANQVVIAEAVAAVAIAEAIVSAHVPEAALTVEPMPPAADLNIEQPPVTSRPSLHFLPIFSKDTTMATSFETTQDTVKSTVSQMTTSAEAALESSKAAMEQMTAKSKEAIETSMKTMDEMADLARGNVEAVIASARAATTGLEQVAAHVTESSRKSFEDMTAAAKSMASAKTPNELMQLQSDFAKNQFDGVVAEFSKMTEMMMKISGDIFEPVQNRMAISTDKMKTLIATK